MAPTNIVKIDQQVTWANSDTADTKKNVDKEINTTQLDPEGLYLVSVNNPSTETQLSMKVFIKEIFQSGEAFSELTDITIASNSAESFLVQGLMMGLAARIQLSNDTGLSGTGGFTADVVVRQV